LHSIRFDRLPIHTQQKIDQRAREEGISREDAISRFVNRALGENGIKRVMQELDKDLDKVPRLTLVTDRKKVSEGAA